MPPGANGIRQAMIGAASSAWCIMGCMGRIIGTTLGAILAIWIAVTAADGILATLKTFLIIGLIALAVFIVVWFLAGRPRRS
jgi:predicted lipid-binding transport protein (Tim44 family)